MISNVVGEKDNTGSITALYRMYKTIDPRDMTVFTGFGCYMYQYAALFGCPAFVTELANYAPHLAFEMYRAGKRRDFETLVALNEKVDPFFQFIDACASRRSAIPTTTSPLVVGTGQPIYQSVCKVAMELIGLPGGKVREPMENINEAERAELRQILIKMGSKVI